MSTKGKVALPRLPTADAWARQWQKHWSKVGAPGYELPSANGSAERALLTQTRTPEKEKARLKRINDEFVRAFKGLYRVGPAVTVFVSGLHPSVRACLKPLAARRR